MPSFEDIMDRPSNEIEKPKPLPVGTYVCLVRGMPRYDKSSKKQTPFVEFTLVPQQVCDDVDEDDLKAMGGFKDKTIRATYYITEDAAWRLTAFLDDCGAGDDSMSPRQRAEKTVNCQVFATIKHRPSDDGKSVFAELASTAKYE